MKTVGNVLWFVFLGWWQVIIYGLLGILMCITIIGIPIGIALLQYAKLMALPFGKEIVRAKEIKDVGAIASVGSIIANIIWFPFGLILAISNIVLGIGCCLTIFFIPAGIVYFRCAKFIIFPSGARVVAQEEMQIRRATRIIRQEMNTPNKATGASAQQVTSNQELNKINNTYNQQMLNSVFNQEEISELKYIFTPAQAAKLIYFPVDNAADNSWICSCGVKNTSNSCAKCGISHEDIFNKINISYISQHISTRKEEERQRIEQRRHERREAMQKNKEVLINTFNDTKETLIPVKNQAMKKIKEFTQWFAAKWKESKEFRVAVISICASMALVILILVLFSST